MTDNGWFGHSSFSSQILSPILVFSSLFIASQASATPAENAPGVPMVELSSQEVGNGEVLLVRVIGAQGLVSGEFEGLQIPFYPNAGASDIWEGLLGVPFFRAAGPASVKISIREPKRRGIASVKGALETKFLSAPFTVVDVPYETGSLTVSGDKLKPKLRDQKRIAREVREISAIYKRVTAQRLWEKPFKLPVESIVTSDFGKKRVYNNKEVKFHQGLDLRAAVGTPVNSPAGGIVVMAKDLFFTGYTVILDHGYGMFTVYAHLSKLKVKVGQKVAAGAPLGLAGMTGRTSGPHLHWGVVLHKEKVNPLSLMKVLK